MTLRIILAAFVLLSFQATLAAQERTVPRPQPDIRLKGDRNLEIGRPAPNNSRIELVRVKECIRVCERDRAACLKNTFNSSGCNLVGDRCVKECKKPRGSLPLRSGPRPIEPPR